MSDKLTARQQKTLEYLLAGSTIKAAADKASVSERQVYRWLDQDAFQQALKNAQNTRLDQVNNRLLILAVKALDTLADVLSDPAMPGQAVASITADRILSQALKWRDLADVEERLTALEQKAGIK